ncbi:hypothetical protein QIG94_28820, partial [Klebsiella pneumoniae]|nr:hypothetical protein [Klebsiella pneumoniae]
SDLPVAKVSNIEPLTILIFLWLAQVQIQDIFDIRFGEFTVFPAKVPTKRLEPLARIDQLYPALTIFGFLVGQ